MASINPKQLRDALLAEDHACDQLAAHLDVIATALSKNNTDQLSAFLDYQTELLQQLETLAERKNQLLENAGFSNDQQGLEQAITNSGDKHLRPLWHQLKSKLQQCQTRNRSNAAILRQSQNHLHAALDLLRGDGNGPSAYGAQGQTHSSAGNRSLGRA